jgi:hypothetical protein
VQPADEAHDNNTLTQPGRVCPFGPQRRTKGLTGVPTESGRRVWARVQDTVDESSESNSFGLGFRLCFPPDLAARRFEILRPDGPSDFSAQPVPRLQTAPVCLSPEHMVKTGVTNTENVTHFKIR